MNANIILCTGWGDSGKGITTDYLCNKYIKERPIVIRFSGGPQAAHAVMVDGKMHTHSSFGSGTFRHNVPTYFSEHALIYPPNLLKEQEILIEKTGRKPKLFIHPLAKLIIPFDVINNRLDNIAKRNGTCGIGIGAAMKRHEGPHKFHAIDLLNIKLLEQKLGSIYKHYVPHFSNEEVKEAIRDEMALFKVAIRNINFTLKDYNFLWGYGYLIFEGSQGIMLDMDHGLFPYVTYANTTSKNALDVLKKMNTHNALIDTTITYVTRCYSTLHGNNPYFRQKKINLINNENEINVENEFQGKFKVGEVNYKALNHAINIDTIYSNYITNVQLVVTCMDQREDFEFNYGRLKTKFDRIYNSCSPDSKDFKLIGASNL